MKTAREIILNALNEELPFITEEIRSVVAERIIREIGLFDVKIFGMNETKEIERGTFTPVRYDLELSMDDILLVKSYNGAVPALFLDPLYIHVLECYFRLLGKDRANTLEISKEECLLKTLASNEETEEAKWITSPKNPIEFIRHGINGVCDAVGLYRTYERRDGSGTK